MPAKHRSAAPVPVYQLYGEGQQWLTPDFVHVESIAARSRLHQWEIRPHRHHGLFQLLWLEQGRAEVQLDGGHGRLLPGSVLLLPQHCVHGFRFSRQAKGVVVTLAYAFFQRLHGALGERLATLAAPRQGTLAGSERRAEVEMLLQALLREYLAQAEHRHLLLESLLVSVLGWLLRETDAKAGDPVKVKARAKADADAGADADADASAGHGEAAVSQERARHYLSGFSAAIERDFTRHLPLDRYADGLGISTAHLNAVCRALAGESALSLVHRRLMLEARRNLVYTSMTVRDIADALGFADPAYFTRFFKRGSGFSPRQFREQAQQAGAALAAGRDSGQQYRQLG